VHIGDVVRVVPSSGDDTLPSQIGVSILDAAGDPLQLLSIHTSCSQPLRVGDVFGAVDVVGLTSTDGGRAGARDVTFFYTLTNRGDDVVSSIQLHDNFAEIINGNPVGPLAPGQSVTLTRVASVQDAVQVQATAISGSCSAEATVDVEVFVPPAQACTPDYKVKVRAATFEYTGAACDATTNFQEGKASCEGGPVVGPVDIAYVAKNNDVVLALRTNVGGSVTVMALEDETLDSDTTLIVSQGGVAQQTVTMHTSCSRSFAVGDKFGPFRVTALDLVSE
jgi:hypothetical protein